MAFAGRNVESLAIHRTASADWSDHMNTQAELSLCLVHMSDGTCLPLAAHKDDVPCCDSLSLQFYSSVNVCLFES